MNECPRCGRNNDEGASYCIGCGFNMSESETMQKKKDTNIGQLLDQKYMILNHLGDGGMGKVYKAEQLTLNKMVAIKILHKNMLQNENQVKRFQREAWAASRLDHPHSIGIIDFGQTEDNCQFIVMECLDGKELTDVIAQEFPLAVDRVVKIMTQVLSVLQEAHAQKIIHRDLKPDNIMLIKRAEDNDFVKVLDFGIAKPQERDPNQPALTMQGIVCGTPEYMSPEQAMGKELDNRTDIYSAGCILYQLLTGRVPFDDNNYQAILMKHIREDPMLPTVLEPDLDIPKQLEDITMKSMSKDREERFKDAVEFKKALEAALNDIKSSDGKAINKEGQTKYEKNETKGGTMDILAASSDSPPPSPVNKNTLDMPVEEEPPVASPKQRASSPASKPPETFVDKESSMTASEAADEDWDDVDSGGNGKLIGIVAAVVVIIAAIGGYFAFSGGGGEEEQEQKQAVVAPKEKPAEPVAKVEPTPEPEPEPEPEPIVEKKQPIKITKTTKIKPSKKTKKVVAKETNICKDAGVSVSKKQQVSLDYYEKGNKAFTSGKVDKAIKYFNMAKDCNPKSPQVYKRLGISYMKKGRMSQAKANLGRYLKLAPRARDAARIKEIYNSL